MFVLSAGARDLPPLHFFQTGPAANPVSYSASIESSPPLEGGVKRLWREADHSPHVMRRLRMNGAMPSRPHMP